MKEAGYGPDKRLKVKVSTRNIATFRDPATILIDHLEAHLCRRRARGDRHLDLLQPRVQEGLRGGAEPHRHRRSTIPTSRFFEGYACGSLRNYNNYCNPEMTKLFEAQSRETRPEEAPARWCGTSTASCRRTSPVRSSTTAAPPAAGSPTSRALMLHSNSIYNGTRFEDVWLDK